jgi:hypothetical protein
VGILEDINNPNLKLQGRNANIIAPTKRQLKISRRKFSFGNSGFKLQTFRRSQLNERLGERGKMLSALPGSRNKIISHLEFLAEFMRHLPDAP